MYKLNFIIYYLVVVEKIQGKRGDFWPILVGFWGVCTDLWRGTVSRIVIRGFDCIKLSLIQFIYITLLF